MSFRISNILDYDYFIALDIGAFKIKALACKIDWQELKIVWNASLRQNKKDMLNWEITDISSISRSIQKCIAKACQWLDSIPSDILVLYNSSELIYDFTSVNYIRKNHESEITMSEIDDMIEDVEVRSLDKIKSKTESRLWIIEAEMKLITTSITWIYVDSQRISNPVWFIGKNVKFNIINIYSPSSRFLIVKNIIRDIEMNLISIVPLPVCLPKLTEEKAYYFDQNLYVDIWYSKITVILQNNSEIIWFNVLNFWYATLEEELRKISGKSYLDIENLLSNLDQNYEENKAIIDEVYEFFFESIQVAIRDADKTFLIKNILLSWAWVNNTLKEQIKKYFEKNHLGTAIDVISSYADEESLFWNNAWSMTQVLSLARAGKELMAIKKDPLVRILRYVIYKYE